MVKKKEEVVFILLPDYAVCKGLLKNCVRNYHNDMFRIETDDGRVVYRDYLNIYKDENTALAQKFIKKFKIKLNQGQSLEEILDSEDSDIVDMVIEKWPEKLL